MTFNDVLLALLAHLRAENKPIIIGWGVVQKYPEGALEVLLKAGLLVRASAAQSIECHACENHCFMDVITLIHDDPVLTRAFIVCDDVEMQSQMGRVQIPLVQLQQWQTDIKRLSKVIAGLLGLKDKIAFTVNQPVIKLGMLKAAKGRRWVTLNSLDLSLEINQHTVPVDEVLYFEREQLFIDQDAIDDLLNREPLRQGKSYIPLTNKREARKLETQMMYQGWQDAYVQLKKQNPTKSNKWCSLQIAKMDIANAKDAETIRKNMVK
ncbi:conserved hypothetical protein [Bathymodiolus platifrons methanotrophic gill symbiont]|uniref:hypothetical protein n=1 Tax=Bathymodiolus platifrons methanotrophic gill symbiont TaxID=113268 RepID=UPI000B41C95E|nr:hypothetical protein [Bathymodiolus platifrons methanotrophic gill symbiont]GAW87344.1 conserved hypothetical protein [Bathymodiolus platifrons methanotrophic gill symbiont]